MTGGGGKSASVMGHLSYLIIFLALHKKQLYFLSLVSIKTHGQKQVGAERVCLNMEVTVHHQGELGQELHAGTEDHGGTLFMACSAFLIPLRTT